MEKGIPIEHYRGKGLILGNQSQSITEKDHTQLMEKHKVLSFTVTVQPRSQSL